MIVTQADALGGYGLFLSKGELGIDKGRVVFLYNLLDLKHTIWSGPELGVGKHKIVFDYKIDGPGLGKGGTGVLYVDAHGRGSRPQVDGTRYADYLRRGRTPNISLDTRTGVALLRTALTRRSTSPAQ